MNRALLCIVLVLTLLSFTGNTEAQSIKDAKVGEWALYEATAGSQMKFSVVKVTAEAITIKTEIIMNDTVLNSSESEVLLKDMEKNDPHKAPDVKISKETLTVKGKKLECELVEAESGGQKLKTWASDKIPVNGVVKTEVGGMVVMTLIDWGEKWRGLIQFTPNFWYRVLSPHYFRSEGS